MTLLPMVKISWHTTACITTPAAARSAAPAAAAGGRGHRPPAAAPLSQDRQRHPLRVAQRLRLGTWAPAAARPAVLEDHLSLFKEVAPRLLRGPAAPSPAASSVYSCARCRHAGVLARSQSAESSYAAEQVPGIPRIQRCQLYSKEEPLQAVKGRRVENLSRL